jgi:predicted ATP-grasp superfamily ATP-dependent carboligase
MAKASAIPIPPTIFVKNFDEGKGISADLTYPVVLKSCFSWIPDGDKVVKGKVIIAENRKKYLEEIELHEAFKFPYMVQERLTGDGLGAFVLMHNGKVKVLFSHHRIREKPPWGGVSVVCESSPIERDIQLYSTVLMENLDWNGVAMVEFKRHHKSGTPMLMEINARFWGSLQLAIDSGIDFPVLLIKQILGEEVEYPRTYNKSRMRWLIGDLDSLYILLTKRSPGLGTTQSLQKKIGGILDFSTEFFRSTCIEDFRYLDYKPFLKKIQTNYLKK